MIKLIAIAAVAAFVAMSAPSIAQSYDPSAGTGNIAPGPKGGMQSGVYRRPLYISCRCQGAIISAAAAPGLGTIESVD